MKGVDQVIFYFIVVMQHLTLELLLVTLLMIARILKGRIFLCE